MMLTHAVTRYFLPLFVLLAASLAAFAGDPHDAAMHDRMHGGAMHDQMHDEAMHGMMHGEHAAAMHGGMKPAEIDTSSRHQTAHFRIAYSSDIKPIPINRLHSWKLEVTTLAGEPVTGAEITIDGDMPEHGHGLPTRPQVTRELDRGVYLVEGMKFQMPGHWVVEFHVAANGNEDTAAFDLMLK